MAKQEFTLGAEEKFTPESVRVNGISGSIWTYLRLSPTGWMHMGKQFLADSAPRRNVVEAFGLTYRKSIINAA